MCWRWKMAQNMRRTEMGGGPEWKLAWGCSPEAFMVTDISVTQDKSLCISGFLFPHLANLANWATILSQRGLQDERTQGSMRPGEEVAAASSPGLKSQGPWGSTSQPRAD